MENKELIYREALIAEYDRVHQGPAGGARKLMVDAPAVDALIIPEGGVGEVSDGYHTFNELYHHRAVLFSVICNANPDKAWKSKLHDTGDMFEGMFIVGIETPQGQATYHYDIEPYWDMFKVKELERAPKWDGHTPEQAIERIKMLEAVEKIPRWIPTSERLPDEELRAYKEKYPKEEYVEVIAMIRGSSDSLVLTYDGEYFEDFYGNAYSVSHWMPMPEAPKETESLEVQDAE